MSATNPSRDAGRMRFRKLRIAWSVAWGMVAVLLCVLWVRSYQIQDDVWVEYSGPTAGQTGNTFVHLLSLHGRLIAVPRHNFSTTPWRLGHNGVVHFSMDFQDNAGRSPSLLSPQILRWSQYSRTEFHIPYWCFIVTFGVVSVIPWVRRIGWRFSLRTLLIATTLVAVVLGLIVWAAKS
jgi:hypothetical protein